MSYRFMSRSLECVRPLKANTCMSLVGFALSVFIISSLSGCETPPPKALPIEGSDAEVTASARENVDAQTPTPEQVCEPSCSGRSCGDDGCGDTCGTCDEGFSCVEGDDASASCVASAGETSSTSGGDEAGAEHCAPTCEETGDECGERCGERCGECSEGTICESGRCVCTPQCAGKVCGADDGCGGVCAPCPRVTNCEECALELRVISQERISDHASTARVLLSVVLPNEAPLPKVADLRFKLEGPGIIGRVGLGSAPISAGKSLVPDPTTGMPYRVDGSTYALMLLSTQNMDPIPSGEWLFFDLQISDTSSRPVTFSLIKREQTFAPPSADLMLWGEEYTEQIVIWPALSEGE